jgi:hypothetical protein
MDNPYRGTGHQSNEDPRGRHTSGSRTSSSTRSFTGFASASRETELLSIGLSSSIVDFSCRLASYDLDGDFIYCFTQ